MQIYDWFSGDNIAIFQNPEEKLVNELNARMVQNYQKTKNGNTKGVAPLHLSKLRRGIALISIQSWTNAVSMKFALENS